MKVLIVDDAPDILDVVSLCFEVRWPEATVLTATDGATAIRTFRQEGADLVVLDLGLPDMDGSEVARALKAIGDVLIIILSVRDQRKDIVRGLEMGADDYVTKPFDQMELLARAQAVLRRGRPTGEETERVFNGGSLAINFPQREVRLRGDVVRLTPTEFNLLYHLASNPGKPMTYRELLTKVWGQEYADAVEYLKAYILHLRRKLEDNPADPRVIATERGIGYKFVASP